MTYDAYGNTTGTTGTAKTPLGYDAQYTSTDTGLIYLRARVYDPATAQFLTVDPIANLTRAPYYYAGDNPLNQSDPSGLLGPSRSTRQARKQVNAAKHQFKGAVPYLPPPLGKAATRDRADVFGEGVADRYQAALGRLDADVERGIPVCPGQRNGYAHLASTG